MEETELEWVRARWKREQIRSYLWNIHDGDTVLASFGHDTDHSKKASETVAFVGSVSGLVSFEGLHCNMCLWPS